MRGLGRLSSHLRRSKQHDRNRQKGRNPCAANRETFFGFVGSLHRVLSLDASPPFPGSAISGRPFRGAASESYSLSGFVQISLVNSPQRNTWKSEIRKCFLIEPPGFNADNGTHTQPRVGPYRRRELRYSPPPPRRSRDRAVRRTDSTAVRHCVDLCSCNSLPRYFPDR